MKYFLVCARYGIIMIAAVSNGLANTVEIPLMEKTRTAERHSFGQGLYLYADRKSGTESRRYAGILRTMLSGENNWKAQIYRNQAL